MQQYTCTSSQGSLRTRKILLVTITVLNIAVKVRQQVSVQITVIGIIVRMQQFIYELTGKFTYMYESQNVTCLDCF